MAKSSGDRIKAAKLRAKKALNADEALWLRTYEQGVTSKTIAHAKKQLMPTVRGEQLAIGGTAPRESAFVQETLPPTGNVSPEETTWTPTVPAAAEGAEVPSAGAPPPPTEGSPVVDATPTSAAGAPPSPPTGDPAAAASFAAMVQLITHVGLGAVVELSAEMTLPDQLRELAADPGTHAHVQTVVGAAAYRVALKYGFKGIPFGDEAIVAGAVTGSVVAWSTLAKRKRAAKKSTPAAAASPSSGAPHVPMPTEEKPADVPVDVSSLWDEAAK